LNTDRMSQTTARPAVGTQEKRSWRGMLVLTLFVLALALVGCGSQTPPYWPDLAIADDTVYVAETSGQVFALSAETGDLSWSYPTVEKRSGGLLSGCSAPAPSDGPFYAAPAITDEYILLGSAGEQVRSLFSQGENRSGLRALNKMGTLQWEFRGAEDRTVTRPTISGNTVYLASSDHSVYAIDLESRDARWVFETENWVWASPLVVEETVFIASMDHSLYAVNAQDGSLVWHFDRSAGALPAAPAVLDDVLYFGSLNGSFYAVEAQSGTLLWEKQVDGGLWATPWVEQDALYFGTLQGKVYALSTADGTELWQSEVGGEIRGTPAYVDGTLYYGCEDGKLYAFDAVDGKELPSPLGQQLDDTSIYTSPVFDGQRLFVVATDGQVFALDVERTAIIWRTNPLDTDQEAR
jgi:eukaryotic-like serine/threonine-protein kinase